MPCTSPDHVQRKSFRIKHDDDKFFSRLMSKETSKSNPSFRIYYGDVPSAVPFMWEKTPGTPKHTFSDNSIPPLTPPPAYYSNNINRSLKNHSRSKLLHNLLRRMSIKKVHVTSSPSSASSSSLSWTSSRSSSDQIMPGSRRKRCLSWGSSVDVDRALYDHHGKEDAPSCGSVLIMKKAFLSIVGRGSG